MMDVIEKTDTVEKPEVGKKGLIFGFLTPQLLGLLIAGLGLFLVIVGWNLCSTVIGFIGAVLFLIGVIIFAL
ncbi:MAG: hypothetical protein STSR0004_04600 [Peptococcaceae bacterium]